MRPRTETTLPAKLPTAGPDRIEPRIEQPAGPTAAAMAQIDQRVILAIVSAMEKRLNEHAAQVEQRIARIESSVARRIEQETSALRAQVVAMQREFAQSVAGIVAEQVAAQVAELTRAMDAAVQARRYRDESPAADPDGAG